MDGPGRLRALQLRRLLDLEGDPDEGELRAAVMAAPDALGRALADEAADSDDVIDRESADAYLEWRLTELGASIPPEALPAVRSAFASRTAAW